MKDGRSFIWLRIVLLMNALGYLVCSFALYILPKGVTAKIFNFFYFSSSVRFNTVGFYSLKVALILCIVIGIASVMALFNPANKRHLIMIIALANLLIAFNCVITGFSPYWYSEINPLFLLYDLIPSGILGVLLLLLLPDNSAQEEKAG